MLASKISPHLRLAVLGATGETGKPFVQQALAAGHKVTAIVRDPSKVAAQPGLSVCKADVFQAASLASVLKGHDAVVSTLGFNKQLDKKMTYFTDSMRAIIEAMGMAEVRRLVTISAWYTNPNNREGQFMYDKMWSQLPGLPNTLDNEGEMEVLLQETKASIDYTCVRAPTLTWDPVSDREIVFEDANWVNPEAGSMFMARADVARAMLSTLDPAFENRMVAIGVKYTEQEQDEVLARFKQHMAQQGDHRKAE